MRYAMIMVCVEQQKIQTANEPNFGSIVRTKRICSI